MKIPPLNDYQNMEIKKKLIKFIIEDIQPFHILKSSSFKEFVHSLNPHFKIPCIDVIKESLFILYDHSINELKEAMQLAQEHGMQSVCWVMLNASEFVYVR
jgi:hypothetical protein